MSTERDAHREFLAFFELLEVFLIRFELEDDGAVSDLLGLEGPTRDTNSLERRFEQDRSSVRQVDGRARLQLDEAGAVIDSDGHGDHRVTGIGRCG